MKAKKIAASADFVFSTAALITCIGVQSAMVHKNTEVLLKVQTFLVVTGCVLAYLALSERHDSVLKPDSTEAKQQSNDGDDEILDCFYNCCACGFSRACLFRRKSSGSRAQKFCQSAMFAFIVVLAITFGVAAELCSKSVFETSRTDEADPLFKELSMIRCVLFFYVLLQSILMRNVVVLGLTWVLLWPLFLFWH